MSVALKGELEDLVDEDSALLHAAGANELVERSQSRGDGCILQHTLERQGTRCEEAFDALDRGRRPQLLDPVGQLTRADKDIAKQLPKVAHLGRGGDDCERVENGLNGGDGRIRAGAKAALLQQVLGLLVVAVGERL